MKESAHSKTSFSGKIGAGGLFFTLPSRYTHITQYPSFSEYGMHLQIMNQEILYLCLKYKFFDKASQIIVNIYVSQ